MNKDDGGICVTNCVIIMLFAVPVSLAKTLMPYHPPNIRGMLGFNTNVEVKVFSKSAGNRTDLWGVEVT